MVIGEDLDNATAINAIKQVRDMQSHGIYSVSGQKVNAIDKAGIYIVNGRKVVR